MRPIEGVLIVITVILHVFFQLNLQQFVIFHLMYEQWADEWLTLSAATMIRGRNRHRQSYHGRQEHTVGIPRYHRENLENLEIVQDYNKSHVRS